MKGERTEAHDRENGVTLATVLDSIINDTVLLGCLLAAGILHIGKTLLSISHVNLGEATVEENLGGEKLELETELLVVDELVPAEVKEGRGKVIEGSVISGQQEV